MKKYVIFGITCVLGGILNFSAGLLAAGYHSEAPKDSNECIYFPIFWMGRLFGLWGKNGDVFAVCFFGLWIGLFIVGVILLWKKVSPYFLFLILPALSLIAYIVSYFYGFPFGRI
jgi:hypothetical protein